MTPEAEFPNGLLDYFAARKEQRELDIAAALPNLEARMAEFVTAHVGEPGLPIVLARMIREAAVQAWARVARTKAEIPEHSVILYETLSSCRTFSDLCPAWRIFDGQHLDDEEENDA